jgi:hypothetical protein
LQNKKTKNTGNKKQKKEKFAFRIYLGGEFEKVSQLLLCIKSAVVYGIAHQRSERRKTQATMKNNARRYALF